MGKIIRGAKVVEASYVVAVPEIETQPETRPTRELDARFADPDGLGVFDDAAAFARDSAGEPAAPQPNVDWERARAEAEALIDKASSDGEALLRDAAQRARELVDRANAQAVRVEEEAHARAHEEGLAQGRAAADAEMAASVKSLHDVVEAARAQRRGVIESAEPELVRLAMAVAERIVYDRVSSDPEIVIESVRHALVRLIGREVVTLRVNPADLEVVRTHRDSLASGGDVEHVRIVEDHRVDRGGVVVETDAGTIDAKVSTQLREARKAMQSADVAAVPAPNGDPLSPASAQAS